MNERYNKAIFLAATAHSDQFDKAGEPYILHCIRVAEAMGSESDKCVAVLHDVLEDQPAFRSSVAILLTNEEFASLLMLTRKSEESYAEFIQRCSVNPQAARIKLADLKDNSRLSRLPTITKKDFERNAKYMQAIAVLEVALHKGEEE